jgi:hypothetical protein
MSKTGYSKGQKRVGRPRVINKMLVPWDGGKKKRANIALFFSYIHRNSFFKSFISLTVLAMEGRLQSKVQQEGESRVVSLWR